MPARLRPNTFQNANVTLSSSPRLASTPFAVSGISSLFIAVTPLTCWSDSACRLLSEWLSPPIEMCTVTTGVTFAAMSAPAAHSCPLVSLAVMFPSVVASWSGQPAHLRLRRRQRVQELRLHAPRRVLALDERVQAVEVGVPLRLQRHQRVVLRPRQQLS